MAFTNGQIIASIREIGRITRLTAMVYMHGTMVEHTMATGKIIICMVEGSTNGQTVDNTKVNISMTKNKALVFIHTQMADLTKATG